MNDPYAILGVAKSASADDIRKAYRKLAKKYHPDLNPGDKAAEAKFKDLSAAYDIVGDAAKRARFDKGEIDATGAERPPQIGAERSAYITFIMFEAAFFCEIMRAGIQSIARGQASARYALGLNYWQVMAQIILPQAFRNMLPVLLTQSIILFQDVSLVSLLNVTDFVGASVKVAQRDSRVVEMYLFVAAVYFVLCFSLSAAVKQLQRRIAIIR